MLNGLYRPGTSWLHRAVAGPKLGALAGLGTLLFLFPALWVSAAGLGAVAAGYSLARLPWRVALAQLRGPAPVLAVLFLVQLWLAGLAPAGLLALRFAVLILAAALVTLTTRTAAMVETIERALAPFARFGVDPARVSLAVSMAIRFIPAIGVILEEVREAQRARGRRVTLFRLAVPMIVRLLKMADEVADAIEARS